MRMSWSIVYLIWFTASPAKLLEWNLILFGTSIDPLEPSRARYRPLVRTMKTRDHDPDEGDSLISTSLRNSMAVAGIILPDVEWMIEHNKPNADSYKPPVYKPDDKPDFEYIKPTLGESSPQYQGGLTGNSNSDVGDDRHHVEPSSRIKDVEVHGGSQHSSGHASTAHGIFGGRLAFVVVDVISQLVAYRNFYL